MTARHVPFGAMFRWISGALHLLVTRPGAMLGGGALTLVVGLLAAAPVFLLLAPLMTDLQANPNALADIDPSRILLAYGLTFLLHLVLMPPLVMGWMRLLRSLDAGQGGSALDLFAIYRDGVGWLRGIGFSLLVMVLAIVLIALFVAALWSPISALMAQAAANQLAIANGLPPEPPNFTASLVFGYIAFVLGMSLFQLASFVGFAELALRPTTSAPASLGRGLAGVGRNVVGLILWSVLLFLILLVVMLIVGLVLALMMVVLAMLSPNLAMALMLLLYVPVLLAMYPLMHAGAYLAWKDMLGGDEGAAAPLAA